MPEQLPHLKPDIQINPFTDGPNGSSRFMVTTGPFRFVVNSATRDLLGALQEGPATLGELSKALASRTGKEVTPETLRAVLQSHLPAELFETSGPLKAQSPFLFHRQLVAGATLQKITPSLTWAFSWPVICVAVLAFGAVQYLTFTTSTQPIAISGWVKLLILYTGIAVGGLFHELGHLTACARHGSTHGGIGFGLYLVFPAFYADVNKAWEYPRRARVSVDLGGIYFQSIFLTLIAAAGLYWHTTLFRPLNMLSLMLMLFTLNPALKFDGYWLLVDLSGIHNLYGHSRDMLKRIFRAKSASRPGVPEPSAEAKLFIAIYAGLVVIFSAVLTALIAMATYRVLLGYPAKLSKAMKGLSTAFGQGSIHDFLTAAGTLAGDSLWLAVIGVVMWDVARRLFRQRSATS